MEPRPDPAGAAALAPDGFVGHERTLRALRKLLDDGARLVTVTGAPGIGKSRFTRRFAALFTHDDATATACVCDVTEAHDVATAWSHVARALAAAAATPDACGRALAARGRCVLVLDNFEQLVPDAIALPEQLAASAPDAFVLVASRERLHAAGERVFELPALVMTEAGGRPAEAVELLTQRIAAVRPGFVPTPAERVTLAAIARELDGLPLALELAAARAGMLDLAGILQRLAQRFALLRRPPRGTSPRHDTLQGALEWSWQALAPHEQAALAQATVFRGGFAVEAAEAVVDLAAFADAPPVLDVLQALQEKSLLRAEDAALVPGRRRLDYFLTVRAFAAHQLDAAATRAAHARHAAYYADAAEALAHGADELRRRDDSLQLLQEQENVLAAVTRQLAVQPQTAATAGLAARLLYALRPIHTYQPAGALLAALDAAVAAAEATGVDAGLRARLHRTRGSVRRAKFLVAEARDDAERAHALADGCGDAREGGRALGMLGVLHFDRGDHAAAQAVLTRALALHRASGDTSVTIQTLYALANIANERGDPERARVVAEEALALAREAGDAAREVGCLFVLGTVSHDRGDRDTARDHFERAIALAEALADRASYGSILAMLGMVDFEDGRPSARARLERAAEYLRAVHPLWHASVQASLAGLDANEDQIREARARFAVVDDALRTAEAPVLTAVAELLRGLLDLALARDAERAGNAGDAARYHAAARARVDDCPPAVLAHASDVRIARRIVAQALTRAGVATVFTAVGGLAVDANGQWIRLADGTRVDLRPYQNAARLLARLAAQRASAPEDPVTHAELVRVVWPGERIRDDAAALRLRATIAQRRRMGLRDALLTRPGGYLLAAVEVQQGRPTTDGDLG